MSKSLAIVFPRLILECLPRSRAPQNTFLGVSRISLNWGDGKKYPLQLISKPLRDPGTPLPGPLFDFPSERLSTTRPLGCTVGWFRGRLFWTTSQAVRGPAGGDSPGSRTRREGAREQAWEGQRGGISAWPPWGQDPLPTRHPQQGPAVLGLWSREQQARAG